MKKYLKLSIMFFWLSSIILYIFSPLKYNLTFNFCCLFDFAISIYFFYKKNPRVNYFDFDTLFIITFFFVFFVYPVFLYPINPKYFFMFDFDFNENVISRATALALVGIESYFLGSTMFKKPAINIANKFKKISNTKPISFTLVIFVIYLLAGGWSFFLGDYYEQKYGAILNYIFVLYFCFLMVSIVINFNNSYSFNSKKILGSTVNWTLLFFTVLVIMLYLYLGSRTPPIQICLILIGLFSTMYYPIKFLPFILIVFLGFILMYLVLIHRSTDTSSLSITNLFDFSMDLVITNRNSFVALDYVDKNGYTYGLNMLGSFVSSIPFLQTIITMLFSVNPIYLSSSMLLTYITIGEKPDGFGVGTNIIADIYLSFGLVGVIILMFLLGYWIAKIKEKALSNIYYMYTHAIMMSFSIFIVRAEYFIFTRNLIWGLIIIYFLKVINKKYKNTNEYNNC